MTIPCLHMRLVSALEKVFPDEEPEEWFPNSPATVLVDERFSFQAAFFWKGIRQIDTAIRLDTTFPGHCAWRQVELSPSELAAYPYPDRDENYLRTTSGLYPDRLHVPENEELRLLPQQWRAIWIDLHTEQALPGIYPVSIRALDEQGNELSVCQIEIQLSKARLPVQRLRYAQWLHADCLANYYEVPVFGESHWRILENFIRGAVRLGVNTLYTPLFTPPLDTEVGGERTTTQLVDVAVTRDGFTFGFERLRRWIELGQSCGMQYFEMSHLFTQWGAVSCPKIVANVEGENQRIFGWENEAISNRYQIFLASFLPRLTDQLREWGVASCTFFHLSDEPSEEHLGQYTAVRAIVTPYLQGFPIMDALSHYPFYEQGVTQHPICAIDRIQPFLDAHVPGLWAYYCCAQGIKVSNRFFAMPSARNRVIGIQLYKYGVEGFLHWGYNFYNTALSKKAIDPYRVTDGDGAFPSGDAFTVYPGEDGIPEDSIRGEVFYQALQDMRALELLESMTSREHVLDFLENALEKPLNFTDYPRSASYLLELHEKVNREIDICEE